MPLFMSIHLLCRAVSSEMILVSCTRSDGWIALNLILYLRHKNHISSSVGKLISVLVGLLTVWFISISFTPTQNQAWCSVSLYARSHHSSLTPLITTALFHADHTPRQRWQHHSQCGQHSPTTLATPLSMRTTFSDHTDNTKASQLTHGYLLYPGSDIPGPHMSYGQVDLLNYPRFFPDTALHTWPAHVPWSSRSS